MVDVEETLTTVIDLTPEELDERVHELLDEGQFEALRLRHGLTVADVVAWFPKEEGIAYLQALIAASEPKPRRRRKTAEPGDDGTSV